MIAAVHDWPNTLSLCIDYDETIPSPTMHRVGRHRWTGAAPHYPGNWTYSLERHGDTARIVAESDHPVPLIIDARLVSIRPFYLFARPEHRSDLTIAVLDAHA